MVDKNRYLKNKIPEMMPVRKWLTRQEASAYLGMSDRTFKRVAIQNELSFSMIGKGKFYYKVSELDKLLSDNIIHRKV